ncbi:hypothetical protein [Enterobacter soli]|uniref:hypothetical protein n=1 Tax=Enterobacter soli TaxID=885040 RepID=UPI000FFEE059|nr:hypothetical protein [Enterobacter soli]
MSSIIAAGFVRPMEKGIILHLAGESEASFEAPVTHTGTPIPFRPPPANLAFPAVVNSMCVKELPNEYRT